MKKLLLIFGLIFLLACNKDMLLIYDSKNFKEQYLKVDEFRYWQIVRLENYFIKSGYEIRYYYEPAGAYMIITPEMIEVKKGNRYILKRKFAENLYNTF